MQIIRKSIATATSITMVVISLALIHPATAIGKENRRAGTAARSEKHPRTLKPGASGLRSAASDTRESNHGSSAIRKHRENGIFDDPFFFDVGVVRSHTRRTKR